MSWAEDMGFDGYEVPTDVPKYDDTWLTKTGESMRICDMTNDHLYHAYRMFNDHRLHREIILRIFKKVMIL